MVLPKYSLPEVRHQETLFGEVNTTFADEVHRIITEGDDWLAAFKNSRYNNYKRGLYPAMLHFEDHALFDSIL